MFDPYRRGVTGQSRPSLSRATLMLTLTFWGASFVLLSMRAELLGQFNELPTYLRRLALSVVGVVLCWGGHFVIMRYDGVRFRNRALIGMVFAMAASVLYALISQAMYASGMSEPDDMPFISLILSINYWLWFFVGWTGLFLGLVYSVESIEHERQLSDAQISGHLAKVTALRYQVNPHFLFNTLNAIASLVPRETKAERLILDLSNFFRVTLSIDPVADISMAREFEIQTLYLNIEKVRYGERLELDIQLADDARDIQIPSLLLQPLVENAIKHGVASSRDVVHVGLSACVVGGSLVITVDDDGAAEPSLQPGTGIGIENVRQRLQSRFGNSARLTASPREGGGFAVVIMINRSSDAA
jgi:two-component system, LytTR family, sensor kinase